MDLILQAIAGISPFLAFARWDVIIYEVTD